MYNLLIARLFRPSLISFLRISCISLLSHRYPHVSKLSATLCILHRIVVTKNLVIQQSRHLKPLTNVKIMLELPDLSFATSFYFRSSCRPT